MLDTITNTDDQPMVHDEGQEVLNFLSDMMEDTAAYPDPCPWCGGPNIPQDVCCCYCSARRVKP